MSIQLDYPPTQTAIIKKDGFSSDEFERWINQITVVVNELDSRITELQQQLNELAAN